MLNYSSNIIYWQIIQIQKQNYDSQTLIELVETSTNISPREKNVLISKLTLLDNLGQYIEKNAKIIEIRAIALEE